MSRLCGLGRASSLSLLRIVPTGASAPLGSLEVAAQSQLTEPVRSKPSEVADSCVRSGRMKIVNLNQVLRCRESKHDLHGTRLEAEQVGLRVLPGSSRCDDVLCDCQNVREIRSTS